MRKTAEVWDTWVFKRWVQSELGAYADLLEGSPDGVKPMRGVASGFEAWKNSVGL